MTSCSRLLLMVIHFGFSAKKVDVETVFLYGDLKEERDMECLKGMNNFGKDCIISNKCIYGLVKAVRHYYKKALNIFKKAGSSRGIVDPCLIKSGIHNFVCR